MRRYFPRFRSMDIYVLIGLLAMLAVLAWLHPADQVWRDAAIPAALIVLYAVISWTKR